MSDGFPIIGTNESVPWELVAPFEAQAIKNHSQTLKRLAERGGLDWHELLAVIEGKGWREIRLDHENRTRALARLGLFQKADE